MLKKINVLASIIVSFWNIQKEDGGKLRNVGRSSFGFCSETFELDTFYALVLYLDEGPSCSTNVLDTDV